MFFKFLKCGPWQSIATILGQDSCLPLVGDSLPMQTLVNGSAMCVLFRVFFVGYFLVKQCRLEQTGLNISP